VTAQRFAKHCGDSFRMRGSGRASRTTLGRCTTHGTGCRITPTASSRCGARRRLLAVEIEDPGNPETLMNYILNSPVEIIRRSGSTEGTAAQRASVTAMRMAAPAFACIGYRGYSRLCKIIAEVAAPHSDVLLWLDDDTAFSFPMNDIYWVGIVSPGYRYEPELERTLKLVKDMPFTFIDAGANFGYWSALVSGVSYGKHNTIAIEPVSATFSRLQQNCSLNNDRFTIERAAVSDVTGDAVHLAGEGHASMSILGNETGEPASTVTIDDLAEKYRVSGPVVLKLDVEGVEIRAIEGAARTLSYQDALILYEDHGSDTENSSSRHLFDQGWTLYCLEDDFPRRLTSISDVARIKTSTKRGYNFAASHRPWW
jgi:FkbM family methyltransferase